MFILNFLKVILLANLAWGEFSMRRQFSLHMKNKSIQDIEPVRCHFNEIYLETKEQENKQLAAIKEHFDNFRELKQLEHKKAAYALPSFDLQNRAIHTKKISIGCAQDLVISEKNSIIKNHQLNQITVRSGGYDQNYQKFLD